MTTIKIGAHTPWGPAETVKELAPGVFEIETQSHGGFWLDPKRNKLVPERSRAATFNGRGGSGWYEEDCDWAFVAVALPNLFSPRELSLAAEMASAILRRHDYHVQHGAEAAARAWVKGII